MKSDLLLSVPSFKAKLRAFYHSWNPGDVSQVNGQSATYISMIFSFTVLETCLY